MKAAAKVLIEVLEIYGRRLSDGAVATWLEGLRGYPEEAVVRALQHWRDTESRAPVPADLVALLDPGARWPSADEAWAVAQPVLGDERASVVWCNEMARAAGEVEGLDDPVAARMAFRAAYDRMVAEAKRRGGRPVYYLSPGWDQEGREAAVREALRLGWVQEQRQVGYRGGDADRGVVGALPGPERSQVPAEVRALADQLRGH
jgi:hypothetical protein